MRKGIGIQGKKIIASGRARRLNANFVFLAKKKKKHGVLEVVHRTVTVQSIVKGMFCESVNNPPRLE